MEFFSQHNIASAAWPKKALLPCGLDLLAALGLVVILIWNQSDKKNAEASAKTSGPLLITPAQQHLGKLNLFEKKDFSFTIKNQGNEPLRIVKVEHLCGCTESNASKDILAPGEVALILGSLNAEDRRGEFSSQISVIYQDSLRKDQKIIREKVIVGAKAVAMIYLQASLDFEPVLVGDNSKPIVFEITKGEAVDEWDDLTVKSAGLSQIVRRISTDKWEVTLKPSKSDIVGSFSEEITLEMWESGKLIKSQKTSANRRVLSKNFKVNPSNVYLIKASDELIRIQFKSSDGKGSLIKIDSFSYVKDGSIAVQEVKINKNVYLEVKVKKMSRLSNAWSGPIFVVLNNGFVRETFQIMVVTI